mmetsp:Transcript_27926/g.64886  ORF Transcript_27926/g.64886 Transcript_27926/m.64886 type:complete len:409 (+) Transcript_27926:105-1331(+)
MTKGDYEFPTLVTCLLILALQVHNPFQSAPQAACRCDGESASAVESVSVPDARVAGNGARPTAAASQAQQAPSYRRGRAPEATSSFQGGAPGLSTQDLLRELDSIQGKAREQQETLAAAGRMPPSSPILQQLKATEAAQSQTDAGRASATRTRPTPSSGQAGMQGGMRPQREAAVPPSVPRAPTQRPPGVLDRPGLGLNPSAAGAAGQATSDSLAGAGEMPMLRRRTSFGQFLESAQPGGLGVILGVGRGEFALRLLSDWRTSQGIFLIDPFIHIWRGYDDPDNLSDREHQLVFEDLRSRLQPFEGRFVLTRDFSYSFAEVYRREMASAGPPTFIYIDANHAEQAVTKDLELWWPLLQPGGVMAGSTYADDSGLVRVKTAVDRFATRHGVKVYLTHDDVPPSWFFFKQ